MFHGFAINATINYLKLRKGESQATTFWDGDSSSHKAHSWFVLEASELYQAIVSSFLLGNQGLWTWGNRDDRGWRGQASVCPIYSNGLLFLRTGTEYPSLPGFEADPSPEAQGLPPVA